MLDLTQQAGTSQARNYSKPLAVLSLPCLKECLRFHSKAVRVSQDVHNWKEKERSIPTEPLAANQPAS
ncbi:hypothetical protein Y1Q_0001550 [Alligator mississippiensis]|uniref:Uncharacterized protein n=1 Tax=Alligator mississippiensis TaxID=8496 RepID=A0A151M9X5_ALLMI|nr:hypothetical protein Y1Q_0001550 [Alligator mississippiensis]